MDFEFTEDQKGIRAAAEKLCARFGDEYWREHDERHEFPEEFYRAVADQGWLGIAMPPAYGGAGLGITEAAIFMQAIAESGAGMSGASSIHLNIFGLNPVVVFGTGAQKVRMLTPLIAGREKACFAITEPDAGLNTIEIKTFARKEGSRYRVHGQKIWISSAQVASKMLLLARTTPREEVSSKTGGLSLFYTTLDRQKIEAREIPKMGRGAVDSNLLFFDGYEIPEDDLIGREGEGFRQLLHGLNPERILIAAEAVGLGRAALRKAAQYARERVVFGRPIGQNQSIQHPLAKAWAQLEAANFVMLNAATRYDKKMECGVEANAAKYLAAEAAFFACEQAVLTLGGMGYAKEYHVERYLRECWIPRLAPVSMQMILSFLAEKVLEQPKSY